MKNEYFIDNHIIKLEYKENVVKVYFYYNNNWDCTDFLYDIEEKRFFAFSDKNFLTDRQEKILKEKIERFAKRNRKK
jgi:hypothetical protein